MMIRLLSNKRWEEELDSEEEGRRAAFKHAMFLENAVREGLMEVWDTYDALTAAVIENVGEVLVEPEEALLYQAPLITDDEEDSVQISLSRFMQPKEELAEEEEGYEDQLPSSRRAKQARRPQDCWPASKEFLR